MCYSTVLPSAIDLKIKILTFDFLSAESKVADMTPNVTNITANTCLKVYLQSNVNPFTHD